MLPPTLLSSREQRPIRQVRCRSIRTSVGSAPGVSVICTGDYNHDGKADVLWQNASGNVAEWQMDSDHIAANLTVGSHSIDRHAV